MRLLTFALCLVAAAAAARQPNVVVLLADDAGWGDYSHNGNHQLSTPHIDSLAKDGTRFDRFFVQPVCSPTRAEFLTGRWHRRLGVYGVSTGQERMNPEEKTVADALKSAGYVTGIFGKWHNGSQWPYHPLARGFDTFTGYTSGHWGEYFDAPLERNGVMEKSKGYIVDVLTDRALQFIERNKDRPFLCYVPFTTPHSPWSVPAKHWDKFKDFPLTQRATNASAEVEAETRCVLAMMENLDGNVGRILTKLKELDLEQETIVVYFSDNGPNGHRWTGGMKGVKGTTDEGGVRSPLLIRWPGKVPAGAQVDRIAGAVDLCPTILALTGAKRAGDRPFDGRDLSPLLLKGKDADWADRLIFNTFGDRVSVRSQSHRLDADGNLFDMIADPGQTKPLQSEQRDLASRLKQSVADWRRDVGMPAAQPQGKGKTKAKGGPGNAVDPRPIQVGYREFPITMLPARDGTPKGGLERSSRAPNSSYFVNWTSKEAHPSWNVEVVNAGRYEVWIDYACPVADAGSTVEVRLGGSALRAKIAEGWYPPLLEQDVFPRKNGESVMREFKSVRLGDLDLSPGPAELTIKAVEMPGKTVMELRRVTLILK